MKSFNTLNTYTYFLQCYFHQDAYFSEYRNILLEYICTEYPDHTLKLLKDCNQLIQYRNWSKIKAYTDESSDRLIDELTLKKFIHDIVRISSLFIGISKSNHSRLKNAYTCTHFFWKYERIVSHNRHPEAQLFIQHDWREVQKILIDLNWVCEFECVGKFFYQREVIHNQTYQLNLSTVRGYVEFTLAIWEDEDIIACDRWDKTQLSLPDKLTRRTGCAAFRNYDELKNILIEILALYDDMKLSILQCEF